MRKLLLTLSTLVLTLGSGGIAAASPKVPVQGANHTCIFNPLPKIHYPADTVLKRPLVLSNSTVLFAPGSTATVKGNNDCVSVGNASHLTMMGSHETVYAESNDWVLFDGNDSYAIVNNGWTVGFNGKNDNIEIL